jgi:Cd2+/Zn2+-exporting ATPase
LIRSGLVLENLARIDTVAFDKTGTLTDGKLNVVSVFCDGIDEDMLIATAAGAARPAPHPMSQAVVAYAETCGLTLPVAKSHKVVPGMGVEAEIDGEIVKVGRPEWVLDPLSIPEITCRVSEARAKGLSVLVVRIGDRAGTITMQDTLRADAAPALTALRSLKIDNLVVLTGDNQKAADALRARLSITEIRADLSPLDKALAVKEMAEKGGVVAMIGDGVNDAPALAGAAVGITLGGIGSDVALDSADVVIMEDRLSAVPEAIDLARAARSIVIQNVVVSILGVAILSLTVVLRGLSLPVAVLFHEGATVIVALNGLRLLSRKAGYGGGFYKRIGEPTPARGTISI